MMMVYGLPEYAHEYEYIVASEVDEELWFWGAFHEEDKAYQVAEEIGGQVIICG